jgi:hypothetical protein
MTDQALNDPAGDIFARLGTVPASVMAEYLMIELPQTAAATLLLLPPERSAKIIEELPPQFRQDVLRRMARSEALLPAPKTVLATVLDHEFLGAVARPVTPDRNEQVRKLISLMSPELHHDAMAALAPPGEMPKERSDPPAAFEWGDLNAVRPTPPKASKRSPPRTWQATGNCLPLLEVVYDRFVRTLSTSTRVATGLNAEISLDYIYLISQDDYLNRLPLPALLCPFTAEGGGYCGMIVASPQLLFEVADTLLGGTLGVDMTTALRRPFTTIERNLLDLILNVMLDDLSIAFRPIASATFRLDRIETNPRFAAIAPPDAAMYQGALRVDFAKGGGKFHLLLSDEALEPLRGALSQTIVPPTHQAKPPLVVPTDAGPKLKLATPPAERRNA